MTHLSREAFVDALDGRLSDSQRTHLASCPRCQRELEALDATMREVSAIEMPEPSPLFWDHFSARVRERITAEPAPLATAPRAWRWWPQGIAVAVGVLVTVALLTPLALGRRPSTVQPTPATTVADLRPVDGTPGRLDPAPAGPRVQADGVQEETSVASDPEMIEGDDEAEWDVVALLVTDAGWEEAERSMWAPRPGNFEDAAQELSPDERRELARLLNAELKRPRLKS